MTSPIMIIDHNVPLHNFSERNMLYKFAYIGLILPQYKKYSLSWMVPLDDAWETRWRPKIQMLFFLDRKIVVESIDTKFVNHT